MRMTEINSNSEKEGLNVGPVEVIMWPIVPNISMTVIRLCVSLI